MTIDKRLNLITASEIKAIYDYPIFSDNDRPYYLSLSEQELEIAKTLKTNGNKIYFALMLSYFKAKTIFFKIDFKKSRLDIVYISKTVFAIRNYKSTNKNPCKNTIIKIKQLICKLFNIDTDRKQNHLICDKLSALTRYNTTPIDIFRGLFAYMQDNNIPIPAYTTLQTLIGNVISEEEQRLINIIEKYLPKYAIKIIDDLLTAEDGIYPMAALKADPKGFNTSELKGELEKQTQCNKLSIACKKIIPKFDISKKNLNYYANLAMYYTSFRLANFPRSKSQIYIICFVYHQSFKIKNNLIDGFVHYVRKYDKDAEIYAKEEIYKSKAIINQYQLKWTPKMRQQCKI